MEHDKILRIERLLIEVNNRLKRIEGHIFSPFPKPLSYAVIPPLPSEIDPPKALFKKPSVGWDSRDI